MTPEPHPTSRRDYVVGLAAGTLSLAGLWEALGLLTGGHSHGGGSLSAATFRRRHREFLDAFDDGDGVAVVPPLPDDWRLPPSSPHYHDGRLQRDPGAVPVYLRAQRWLYTPETLRLAAGVPYQFRMMSTDVTHGAAVHLGPGSSVHRLPPEQPVTAELTFPEPGRYPVYCSYYCGDDHAEMRATIEVVANDGTSSAGVNDGTNSTGTSDETEGVDRPDAAGAGDA